MSVTSLDAFSTPALRPIGVVHTSRREPIGTPLQPRMASGFRGEVEVLPEYEEGLMDIEGFTRIWLLVLLHRAAPAGLRLVPYRDTVSRGVFATRAPARPNGLGISAVKLLARERNHLFIDEVDLLDGTPSSTSSLTFRSTTATRRSVLGGSQNPRLLQRRPGPTADFTRADWRCAEPSTGDVPGEERCARTSAATPPEGRSMP